MATPKYWRVLVKGARKFHLSEFSDGTGSGDLAICGKALPGNNRRGSATTVAEPDGSECAQCLLLSGHLAKRPRRNKTSEQLEYEGRIRALTKVAQIINGFKISNAEKQAVMETILKIPT